MTTTRIIELSAQQVPFPYGQDANNRVLIACNYLGRVDTAAAGVKVPLKMIVDAGLGVEGTSLFVGPTGVVPDVDTPIVTVTMTSGMRSWETHNLSKYPSLSFQVMVRARDYVDAEARAQAIFDAIDGTRDESVTTT